MRYMGISNISYQSLRKRRDTGGKKKKRKPLDIFINNEIIVYCTEQLKKILGK